jgi:hypothetical protein
MIAFNHKLVFVHEPQFNSETEELSFETIKVKEDPLSAFFETAPLKSGWLPMSGQMGRYWSLIPFEKADRTFSWGLEIKDVVFLVWDADKREILYRKEEYYASQRLLFWVLHTFLPLVFELERTYRILHVGSVEVEGRPILFSAFSFGGKSTLTDYFLKKGHALLSDDSLGVAKRQNTYYAVSSYPFHRPYRELETLGNTAEKFVITSRPVHAVYTLEKASPEASVAIKELKGIEKFKAFHYSSFIDFDFMKKERFEFFSKMAQHVPVYRIVVPWELDRLDEVYETIVAHCT